MIPKKIHYVWFGGQPLPLRLQRFIKTWQKYLPDWEIIRWDETNAMYRDCQFFMEAYNNKKWAFASDYARVKAIYEHGGLYLDTDVEICQPLGEIANNCFFTGLDMSGMDHNADGQNIKQFAVLGCLFGAQANHPVIKELLDVYDNRKFVLDDGRFNTLQIDCLLRDLLLPRGLKGVDQMQHLDDGVIIYDSTIFTPYKGERPKSLIAIHYYENSWINKSFGKRIRRSIGRTYLVKILKKIVRR